MININQYSFLKEFQEKSRQYNDRLPLKELEKLLTKHKELIPGDTYRSQDEDGCPLDDKSKEIVIYARLKKAELEKTIESHYGDLTYSLTQKGIRLIEEYDNSISSLKIAKNSNTISIIAIAISILAIIVSIFVK